MILSLVQILLSILTCALLAYMFRPKRPKSFPPGPAGLPFVGNLLQFGPRPHHDFMRLSKSYGNIMGFDFGRTRTVVLNDYRLIREAFSEMAFSGRPDDAIKINSGDGVRRGILMMEGKPWAEQRRFVLRTLKDCGFGSKAMEGLVLDEVHELIDKLRQDVGKPILTQNRFNAAVLNALWSIITGKRYSHDDPVLNDLIQRLTTTTQRSGSNIIPRIIFYTPWLAKLLVPFFKSRRVFMERTLEFIKEIVDSHRLTYQRGSERDFVDMYLSEVDKTTDPQSSFYRSGSGGEADKQLITVLLELFIAGAETTSTSLQWAFLLLAKHPEVQQRMYEEIEREVGRSRSANLADRQRMPFTEAVIAEVLRFSAILPQGLRHATTEDVHFHGHFLPKGTSIIANLYGVMRDVNVWGDPDNFRPQRFLSPDGRTFVRHEAILAFSAGRRVCPGESLGRDQLFLFLTNLFQVFRVDKKADSPDLLTETIGMAVLHPVPQQLVLVERQ